MPTFEQVADLMLPELCADCPMRNISGKVEMARMDAEASGELDGPEMAMIEADAAAELTMTAVFKQKFGCEGVELHGTTCECGNNKGCSAFSKVVDLINE